MSSPISISLPRSKSIVIRCLIIHYVKTGKLLPVFENDPNDIKIVYNALKNIDLQKQNKIGEPCIIDVEDCGAAYRFLMPLLATTHGAWLLTGSPRLLERPIIPLVNFLKIHGAHIEKVPLGWNIQGREFQIDNIEIDTTETTQFVSAVMMVQTESRILNSQFSPELNSGLNSQNPYIRMTERILQISDSRDAMHCASAFSDWSAAIFWLANALLTPNAHYLLKDLHFDGLQGDVQIVPWFEKFGLCFNENEDGIEVKYVQNMDIGAQNIDVAQTPDLALILAVLAVCYPFQLTMSGLKTLNLKESNRLNILENELSKFTKVEKKSENEIIIYKRTEKLPKLFQFDSHNDHRFVMAWALFRNFGKVDIQNAECVKKSYPLFDY